jgi:hypothetical protein
MFIRILCDLEPYVEERKKDKVAYRKYFVTGMAYNKQDQWECAKPHSSSGG